MPVYQVNVKWQKQTYKAVELSTDEPPELFKARLFSLTSVPPDRQKVMLKGMVIKDEWGAAKIRNGATLLMMGTAEALPQAPVEKTVFLEDMTESERVSYMNTISGLGNLGNTCYMNSTVQVLKTVPELTDALKRYEGGPLTSNEGDLSAPITASLRDLYLQMDKKNQAEIQPFILVQLLRMYYPQFNEKNNEGHFVQQDANECFLQFMRILQQNLKPVEMPGAVKRKDLIDQVFGIDYNVTMKCEAEEAKDEPEATFSESALQLNCFISQDTKYMMTGINSKFSEVITKRSPTLDRDAEYQRTSKVNRLPAYLCVQMVRFYYKEKGNINAKILKNVVFPMQFDMYELCTPELQAKLKPMRDKFLAEEERKSEEKAAMKMKGGDASASQKVKKEDVEYESYEFPDDPGSSNSGYYELRGVITHQGRSSSSGHYVGWVRSSGDEWLKCDDDDVSPQTSEDILKLSGGGDWHIAYLLLYGPRKLEKRGENSNKIQSAAAVPMETEGAKQS